MQDSTYIIFVKPVFYSQLQSIEGQIGDTWSSYAQYMTLSDALNMAQKLSETVGSDNVKLCKAINYKANYTLG